MLIRVYVENMDLRARKIQRIGQRIRRILPCPLRFRRCFRGGICGFAGEIGLRLFCIARAGYGGRSH